MGWETNKKFYHGINPDKREDKFKTQSELAFDGQRISLTFRNIVTFIDENGQLSGQGARKKEEKVLPKDDALNMLKAFSQENRDPNFDWDEYYGNSFDAINFDILDDL